MGDCCAAREVGGGDDDDDDVVVGAFLEVRYDCFHLEDCGGGGFEHVDAVFGDFVQGGEVGCFDYVSGRSRVLADAVQSASLFGPEPAC